MSAQIAEGRSDWRRAIAELRTELKAEIADVKAELKAEIAARRTGNVLIKWTLGVAVALMIAVFFKLYVR